MGAWLSRICPSAHMRETFEGIKSLRRNVDYINYWPPPHYNYIHTTPYLHIIQQNIDGLKTESNRMYVHMQMYVQLQQVLMTSNVWNVVLSTPGTQDSEATGNATTPLISLPLWCSFTRSPTAMMLQYSIDELCGAAVNLY